MSLFNDHILPYCLNVAMRNKMFLPYRRRIIPAAQGRVLEVGLGSGLNLPFYCTDVSEIVALEPSRKLADMAARKTTIPLEVHLGSAESMPFDNNAFDTVATTWTLCTIPGVEDALGEMRRVLRPGGRLLFAEHGLSPDAGVARWQNRLTPAWRTIAGGCHMNRPIQSLIQHAGLRIQRLETGYAKGPRVLAYMYAGRATKPGRA